MTMDQGATSTRRYDWEEVSPSYAVVDAVTTAEHVDPNDAEQLYEQVDPDALDALIRDARQEGELAVEFLYLDRRVTVAGDGRVEVG